MSRRKKRKYKTIKMIALLIFVSFVVVIVYNVIQNNKIKEETSPVAEVKNSEEKDNNSEIAAVNKKNEIIDQEINVADVTKDEKSSEAETDQENQKNINIYKTILAGQSVSFTYPDTWQANQLEEENKFSFGPKGQAIVAEYQGDIIIAYKENDNKVPIERYYDGLNDINLFEDASGGFEKKEEGSNTLYLFKDLIGYTSSTVGVFVLNDSFVEMTDVYNKHQDDGVFDQLIQSFKAE